MKRLLLTILVLGLMLGAADVQAGQAGNCSPEGTWYGYNNEGMIWIVTISRSGPTSYTAVMDWGPNSVFDFPWVAGATDWRGEFVKTGPNRYDFTTMALWRGDETAPFPFALGFCPLTAEFTSCDSWQGGGTCAFYSYEFFDEDPFETGSIAGFGDPLQASFKRMPMSFPD